MYKTQCANRQNNDNPPTSNRLHHIQNLPIKMLNNHLSEAIRHNHPQQIARLVASGASPNSLIRDKNGWTQTPLVLAIRSNNHSALQELLTLGANPNMTSTEKSPLWFATKERNLTLIKELLNNRASIKFPHGSQNPINLITRFIHTTIDLR